MSIIVIYDDDHVHDDHGKKEDDHDDHGHDDHGKKEDDHDLSHKQIKQ